MIKRLTLTGFGRFQRAEFALSPFTLVYGPNEAGKTTFFDGLYQALCRPSETKKSGRLLKERYGPGRKAQAETTGDAPITDEEFMNLYAIRAGDLRLDLDQGTDWLERLKSRLFHGGLDPAALSAEFEKRSSDSRAVGRNKELDKTRETAAAARRELDARLRERDSLLAREADLAGTEARLAETRELRAAAREQARILEEDSAFEEKIAQRQKLSSQLARLEEWEALEASALESAPFREDRRREWERLEAATRAVSARIQAERGKRDAQADLAAEVREEGRALREAKAAAVPVSALAARLAAEARAMLESQARPRGMPWWSLLLAGCLIILGGAGAYVLPGAAGLGAAVLGLAGSTGAVLFGLRARKVMARDASVRALSTWKDAWATESGSLASGPGVAAIATAEGFLRAMEALSREREALEAREADVQRRADGLRLSLEASDSVLSALREEEQDRRREEREWFTHLGVSGPEDYALKHARSLQVQAELPKRRGELRAMAPDGDFAVFRRELTRKLRNLDEEGVPDRGRDEAAMQRLRLWRQELHSKLEDLDLRERDLIARKEGVAGEIRGALGKLAAEIVEWEDRLGAAEAEIQAMELDKKAAALALSIFKDIGDGADMLLAGLSREIAGMLAQILPGDRSVSMLGLEGRRIQVGDAGGGHRSLDHLSTGTKDAVVLAAKLALALQHREGPGILVLDDPFLAMDDERETRALRLLGDFHFRHGWQIILLTKESHLLEKAAALVPGAGILDLRTFHGLPVVQ